MVGRGESAQRREVADAAHVPVEEADCSIRLLRQLFKHTAERSFTRIVCGRHGGGRDGGRKGYEEIITTLETGEYPPDRGRRLTVEMAPVIRQ